MKNLVLAFGKILSPVFLSAFTFCIAAPGSAQDLSISELHRDQTSCRGRDFYVADATFTKLPWALRVIKREWESVTSYDSDCEKWEHFASTNMNFIGNRLISASHTIVEYDGCADYSYGEQFIFDKNVQRRVAPEEIFPS